MKGHRILIVDDEPDILEFLGYILRKEGYDVTVQSSGDKALNWLCSNTADLIILDVMMPGKDGFTVCREIRSMTSREKTVVAFLTARGDDPDEISGFDAGADDYIEKPVHPSILLSRIKALLSRKVTENKKQTTIHLNDLSINPDMRLVTYRTRELRLPKKEFDLLFLLASSPGKVFRRETILEKIWGDEVVVGDRTIDVHVRKLREKINDAFIRTVKGVGYAFDISKLI